MAKFDRGLGYGGGRKAMGEEASIRTLIAFLREELATVVSYRRALPRFAEAPDGEELRACLASHERRIATLEQRIRFLGGDPDAEEDQEAAAVSAPGLGVGDDAGDAAIAALEASEDRGLKHYLDDVCKLDRDTRTLVAREILPEQVRTYDSLSDLKLTRRL
ncbi:MAG TPA: ferritin [Polyangia bacterium]|nr:ferritin [Polyangia bacterium]